MQTVKSWVWGHLTLKIVLLGLFASLVAFSVIHHIYIEPLYGKATEVMLTIEDSLTKEIVVKADEVPEIRYVKVDSELLNRIADCESGVRKAGRSLAGSARQFTSKGEVVRNVNKNRSHDIGKYQINFDVWGMKAMEMGFNLFTEEGNTHMAEWIFVHRGTGDWESSASCWRI